MRIYHILMGAVALNIMLTLLVQAGVVGAGWHYSPDWAGSEYDIAGNYTPTFHTTPALWLRGISIATGICDTTSGTCNIGIIEVVTALGGIVYMIAGFFVLLLQAIVGIYWTLLDVGLETDVAIMLSAPYYLLFIVGVLQFLANRNLRFFS